jgi:hypothetical protein
MKMRSLAVISLFAGAVCMLGQTSQVAFQTDLQSEEWKIDRGLINGASLPYTMDFADDDSLWIAISTELSAGLQSRDTSSSAEHRGKVLHLSADGAVVGQCDIAAPQWNYLRLFAQRADGFTLEMGDKLVAYDSHCKQRSTYPIDSRTAFVPSPNRSLLFTRTRDNHVHVLNGDNLAVIKELDLPESIHRDRVFFSDRTIIYPVTMQAKGCWQSQFTRMEIASGQTTPWVSIDCARFNLLGDDHIVYSNTGGDAPLRIIGGTDGAGAAYNPPHDARIDLSVLDSFPVASPASLRIVEELIESKGRHTSLDMSGKFVGRDIVLLDMHTGTALLTVKVPMDSLTYSYALSRDGKKFAVLLNSKLTVYQVP